MCGNVGSEAGENGGRDAGSAGSGHFGKSQGDEAGVEGVVLRLDEVVLMEMVVL